MIMELLLKNSANETIEWNDFERVELRVGTIVEVHEFPGAKKPAYKIFADFGDGFGIKKSSAQITDLYRPEDLVGKQIIGVLNFAPRQIGKFMSEFLVTGFVQDSGAVVLAIPERKIANGLKLA